jgi:hypothetical protein
VPGKLQSTRTAVNWADAIGPGIAADKVATRPAQDGHPQRFHRGHHVCPETARVAERRSLIKDAAINAPAKVLDESPEYPAVHATRDLIQIDPDSRRLIRHSLAPDMVSKIKSCGGHSIGHIQN